MKLFRKGLLAAAASSQPLMVVCTTFLAIGGSFSLLSVSTALLTAAGCFALGCLLANAVGSRTASSCSILGRQGIRRDVPFHCRGEAGHGREQAEKACLSRDRTHRRDHRGLQDGNASSEF
ncbi:hypothetical protein BHM03_00005314 [Ensete ventricosum]|nr:hypothetical protein BHM03_00005314 [Ensete ventricosum]